jgi:superfamily II DNA or RNA helicase
MESLLDSPIAGRDFHTPKKAKAPHQHGALSEVKKQSYYNSSSAVKTLRPHQQEAQEAVFSRLEAGISRQLIEAATGTGKTFIAVNIAQRFERVLFLVHREELLHQTIRAFQDAGYSADDIGVIWKGRQEINKRFIVGMIQTIHARLNQFNPNQFDCLILDEAHHATAKSWREVAEHFLPQLRLGLSATPERADGAPLNDLFDEIVYSLGIRGAIEQGLLVRPLAIQTRTELNLEQVKVRCGDFAEGELQAALDTEERNSLIVQKWTEHAASRKTLVFAAGIAHSASLAAAFKAEGIAAEYVYGSDPERAAKLRAFSFGEIQVLTNAMVLTEGFDEPSAGAIVFARLTRSRTLYAQMLGRGLRLFPGKEDCKVLDFVDMTGRHSIITAWNFFGHETPAGDGVIDCSQPVKPMTVEEKEKTLKLKDVTVVDRIIDLLQPPPKINSFFVGSAAWHQQPATDKQIAILARNGLDAKNWTRGQASSAIGNLPITPQQRRALLARGFNTLTQNWNCGMAERAFELAEQRGVKPDWSLVREVGL